MPENLIDERIESLVPEYQAFIVSEMPTVIAQTFAETYSFDAARAMALENGIQLLLLFFFTKDQLVTFIVSQCQLDQAEAELLLSGILLALPAEIRSMYEVSAKQIFGGITDFATDIKATESLLASSSIITPTQAYPEPTYTTTQAAILQEGVMTPPPQAQPSNIPATPRWDSE